MATVVPQLEEVREKLVDAVLVVCAVLMVPTAVLSWFRVYTIGVQPIMFIESAIAIAMFTVAFLRSGLSLHTKSIVVIGMSFTLAMLGLWAFGLVSRGTDVFILIAVLTTILLGKRVGWWSIMVTCAAAAVLSYLVSIGLLRHQVDLGQYAASPMTWIFSIAIVLFLGMVAVTMLGGVQDALLGSIRSLQEQAVDLSEARDQAEAANRSKSAFIANVSHEFRTPLNAIVGYADIHRKKVDDEKAAEDLGKIAESGRALALLVESILELSRLEAGDLKVDPIPLDMDVFLKSNLQRYRIDAEAKGLEMVTRVEDSVPNGVSFDEVRLGKTLGYLVDNAVKFTSEGEVEVLVSGKTRDDGKADVGISVRDTGVGIPENQLQAVMAPFTQRDGQAIGEYGGTGIGLSLTKRTVELMGGRLEVESQEGEGSLFTIVFEGVEVG